MLKKLLVASAIGITVLATPAAAFADSCSNVSRATGPCGTATTPTCNGPVIQGNWIWLPSVGGPLAWGFAPPGASDSVAFSFPGAKGNYTNGQTSSLLGMSTICNGGVPARQTTHGIQSGCV